MFITSYLKSVERLRIIVAKVFFAYLQIQTNIELLIIQNEKNGQVRLGYFLAKKK